MHSIKLLFIFTFLDTISNRMFKFLVASSLLLILSSPLLAGLFGRSPEVVSIDVSLSVMWFSILVYILFYVSQELSVEKNEPKISMMLSRPISKSNYIVGKSLGLIAGAATLVVSIGCMVMAMAYGYPLMHGYEIRFEMNYLIIVLSILSCLVFCIGSISFVAALTSKINTAFFIMISVVGYLLICNGIPVLIVLLESMGAHGFIYVFKMLQIIFPDYSAFMSIIDTLVVSMTDKEAILLVIQAIINTVYVLIYSFVMMSISYISYGKKEISG